MARGSPESSRPVADNGVGIVGVAPGARLMALRACWQNRQHPNVAGAARPFVIA